MHRIETHIQLDFATVETVIHLMCLIEEFFFMFCSYKQCFITLPPEKKNKIDIVTSTSLRRTANTHGIYAIYI